MPLLAHIQFSTETLVMVSVLLTLAGLICSKGTPDVYSLTLLLVMAGLFFLIRDYVPTWLIYAVAIAMMVKGVLSRKSVHPYMHGLELLVLTTLCIVCGLYFNPSMLENLAIIMILAISFVFLV